MRGRSPAIPPFTYQHGRNSLSNPFCGTRGSRLTQVVRYFQSNVCNPQPSGDEGENFLGEPRQLTHLVRSGEPDDEVIGPVCFVRLYRVDALLGRAEYA